MMNENNMQQQTTDDDKVVRVRAAELPAYCPTDAMGLWNSHPRVYIPLQESREAACPYCGTQFELLDDSTEEGR